MFDKVELRIHHGGNFVTNPETKYIGGEVECIAIDPDLISYPHLLKALQTGSYGNIAGVYFKRPSEPMDMLHELHNDESTLHLIHLASTCGKCDVYVEHGLDEVELLLPLPLPPPTEVVPEVLEEIEVNTEEARGNAPAATEPEGKVGYESDAEVESGSHSEVQGKPHCESDAVGKHGVENSDGEVDSVEYDSSNPPSYVGEEEEDDGNSKRPNLTHASYNPDSDPPHIELAMLFEDSRQFKNAIIKYAVVKKKDLHFVKNDAIRVRVKCALNCPYECYASWENSLKCFQTVSAANAGSEGGIEQTEQGGRGGRRGQRGRGRGKGTSSTPEVDTAYHGDAEGGIPQTQGGRGGRTGVGRGTSENRGRRRGRGKKGRSERGFGVYFNASTGETIVDPGQASEVVIGEGSR